MFGAASSIVSPATGPANLIDGDTISVKGERIRILDIECARVVPEPLRRRTCAGAQGKERLRALLDSGPLRIERQGNDRHGRTLARVYDGGINVG